MREMFEPHNYFIITIIIKNCWWRDKRGWLECLPHSSRYSRCSTCCSCEKFEIWARHERWDSDGDDGISIFWRLRINFLGVSRVCCHFSSHGKMCKYLHLLRKKSSSSRGNLKSVSRASFVYLCKDGGRSSQKTCVNYLIDFWHIFLLCRWHDALRHHPTTRKNVIQV